MVQCVSCGVDIKSPLKEWSMQPKEKKGPALHISHFACPQCGKKFRVADKLVLA